MLVRFSRVCENGDRGRSYWHVVGCGGIRRDLVGSGGMRCGGSWWDLVGPDGTWVRSEGVCRDVCGSDGIWVDLGGSDGIWVDLVGSGWIWADLGGLCWIGSFCTV